MKYLIKILLVSIFFNQTIICSGQDEKTIDYHVHVYSQELLDNLSAQGYDFSRGSFEFTCSNRECSEIDKIKSNNFAKMVLLSSPYTYKKLNDTENIDDLRAFIQRENNFLKDLVYSNRDNLYGFCGINPNWEFALEEVVRCIDTLKMDGIKFHFQANQIDFENATTKKNILSILKYLFTKDAPVLIHLNGYDLTSGGEIAREFIQSFIETTDEQFIIFAHSGGPGGFT